MTSGRLLIVEDEGLVALDLESRLRRFGYEVVGSAASADDAFDLAAELRPDLILMDIHLADGSDGIEAARRIWEAQKLPVVFLTAYADTATLDRAGGIAPYGYVVKPFEERSLAATLQMALARRRAELKLQEIERWLATTLHSIGDAVVSVGTDGLIDYFNPEAERLTGWACAEALGRNYQEVLCFFSDDPTHLPVPHPVAEALALETVVRLDGHTVLFHKSGVMIPVADSVSPTRDETGKLTGVVMVLSDRTAEKRAEEERRRNERKLQDIQRWESLGRLSGGIAHDFNNLLHIILMNSDLLALSLPKGGHQQLALTDIQKAASRAGDLCQQMLAYAGRGALRVRPFDLSTTVEEAIAPLRTVVSRNAELQLHLGFGLPPGVGDTNQIQQLIHNLVLNASDALEERPGEVSLETRLEHVTPADLEKAVVGVDLPPDDYLLLAVRDTGGGISPEIRDRIFDPFFSTKFAGRGLGLAAVLGIVRSHHGALTMETSVGKGSCFRIFLPISKHPLPAAPEAEATVTAWQGGGTVLVVDDEATICAAADRALQHFGFTMISARDGEEALQILACDAAEIRLVLTDLTMPRLDGVDLTRSISRLYPAMPIVLMSGFSASVAQDRFAQLPVRAFLQKPFSLVSLEKTLREILG